MQKKIVFLLMAFLFATTSAFAGAGHDHGPAHKINQEQAGKEATKIVGKLVQADKLEKTWTELKPVEVQQKTYGKSTEWVITFSNPQAENKEKQTLYVFLNPEGKYKAANFTGK